jgi:hypothetical protein
LSQAQHYEPKFKSALQDAENPVYIAQNEQPSFKPDDKALKWQENNEWFGKDEEMTSLALGLHEKLVRSGISPTSDEYYRRIDTTMQKRFPEYFGDATLDEETPAQRTKPSTVVAPATRSTAPKKVRLTKTQVALAKKFGLTPEQYARETGERKWIIDKIVNYNQETNFKDLIAGNLHHYYLSLRRYLVGLTDGFVLVL